VGIGGFTWRAGLGQQKSQLEFSIHRQSDDIVKDDKHVGVPHEPKRQRQHAANFAVAINVADAFYGGGAPNQSQSRNFNYN
jgi:hypothetical protein